MNSAHWTEGYVADLGYPHAYIAELNPLRLQLPFLAAGLAPPEVRTACDLGFGQGLSVNIHAAASDVLWHGNDFSPDQALNARELAAASGARARLTDESFSAFCARGDLPEFDFIGLHGVWSWISDENRALIVDFIRSKLKVGGVVYIGYNTQPGWAAAAPLRELMVQVAQRMVAPDRGITARIAAALDFVERLLATDPAFARANPGIAPLLASLKQQDTHYLAHEYFNRSWRPMSFTEMAAALEPARLSYACSAHHGIESLDLSPPQQELLRGIADPVLRESVRDFCMNQQFRKDYWVKGARRLYPLEQGQALRALSVVLLTPRADVAASVSTVQGVQPLDPQLFGPLLDALADHAPKSLQQLEQAFAGNSFDLLRITEALNLLAANGDVAVVQPEAQAQAARASTDRLNMRLLSRALASGDISHLACPASGGAVVLNRIEQLFVCAVLDRPGQGAARSDPRSAELAQRVWELLKPQGRKLLHDGQALDSDADNLAALDRLAQVFVQRRLPLLRALGVYPDLDPS